jgi:hypothetical protein
MKGGEVNMRSIRNRLSKAAVLLSVILAAGRMEAQVSFTDVGEDAGTLTSLNSHGSAFFDYTGDGYADIFVVHNVSVEPDDERPHALLRNLGDGTFSYTTDTAGVWGYYTSAQGVAVGDYDNDGDRDLCIAMGRKLNTLLYRNRGDGTFQENSGAAGVYIYNRGRCLSFVDYNNDGWLDLFVLGEPPYLFKNNRNGTFTQVAHLAGLNFVHYPQDIYGFAFGDTDNDGDMDLFVPRLAHFSKFFINNGDGTFSDSSGTNGLPTDSLYMGAVFLDYNNDGYMDLFTRRKDYYPATHCQLFRNNQDGTFTDVSFASHVTDWDVDEPGFGGGLGTGDFDNDGYVDILILTKKGYQNRLLHNNGNGTFTNIGTEAGVTHYSEYWSAPIADYNHDGYLDIYFCRNGAYSHANPDGSPGFYASLYRNNGGSNHWLHIDLVGVQSSRDGVGARLVAYAGGLMQTRQVLGGESYKVDDVRVEFGLGSETNVDSLIIYWPSGIVQRSIGIPADQIIEITEQEGTYYYQLFSLSGHVSYYQDALPVPGVQMGLSGSESATTTTASSGNYAFTNLQGGGSLTVTPSLAEGAGMGAGTLSSQDAALIARHVVGLESLSGKPATAADVNGDGQVDMGDAAFIARFMVGFSNPSGVHAGQWVFTPESRSYASLVENLTGQDFEAMVMGDVDGSWTAPAGPAKAGIPAAPSERILPVQPVQRVEIPVRVSAEEGVISADLWLRFDPARVTFIEARPGTGTIDFHRFSRENPEGGLKIAMFSPHGIPDSEPIVHLVFDVNLEDGVETLLSWERLLVNGRLSAGENVRLTPGGSEDGIVYHFRLMECYPNPFNPSTKIRYSVDVSSLVSLTVFDMLGRPVRRLVNRVQPAGEYEAVWDGRTGDGRDAASGMYVVRLQAGVRNQVRKVMKVK